ncbi:uncharacterized protein LOC114530359 [Dendronephthya gigantea]|uniref:uncharacterized protein LOC114530359 n=1 Tax=Dendronephthya gigantea TaxID=151771 RepID=UPI00106CDF39|nr:uncharacterized protein LOC114530359 [Dendronephthya gigantea]
MEILVEGQLDYFEERSWKKRYFVMKYEISSALRYIEIYKDKNWQKQLPRHVVNLHPGYEVRRRDESKKKYCFSLKTTDHVLLLASEDENAIINWMATLEEYNLVKSFCVQPQDTETMIRIEAVFPCHLQLVHSEVRLVSAMDGKLLGLWPFKCIRRYKFVGNMFSIEAGRKAPTGEGVFEFISNECSEIYRVMDTIIRTKAGNTTVRRLASERLSNQVQQEHQVIRKVNSVPVNTPTKKTNQYDYANPTHRPPPPPVPLPSPPVLNAPSDPTYDILSPGAEGTETDGKAGKKERTLTNDSEYNTLQFGSPRPVETRSQVPQRAPKMAGSPGSYDTLRFGTSLESTSNKDETLKAKGKDDQYDTLQFDPQSSSFPIDDNVSELPQSSGSFYNTLDHSSGSIGSVGSISSTTSNTYDCLDTGNKRLSNGSDTYDMLGNSRKEIKPQPPRTLDLGGNTYDALQHAESQKPTGRNSPVTSQKPTTPSQGMTPPKPNKPPPRKKPPSIPKQSEIAPRKASTPPEAPTKKISAGAKPNKPFRAHHKNPQDTKDSQKTKGESISDVIQKRLATTQPVDDDDDDGSYASVDHEYASIDYSKVSKPETTDSSDIYTDPDQDDTKIVTPIPKPAKPAKPSKPNPKAMMKLFKKGPAKAKSDSDGGHFADELKKKLELKLKKTEDNKSVTTSQTGQTGNDDDIYDEVDTCDPFYSEPDPYNEPAV